MKMAKKLLALVLTGVMAVSMLTGCADSMAHLVAKELEGMLKVVDDKATVKVIDSDLASWALSIAKNEDGSLKNNDNGQVLKLALRNELNKDGNFSDTYVWCVYFPTKALNKTTMAQKIAKEKLVGYNDKTGYGFGFENAANGQDVTINGVQYVKPGNSFKLSMKEFTVGSEKYVMFVVTCKAVEAEAVD